MTQTDAQTTIPGTVPEVTITQEQLDAIAPPCELRLLAYAATWCACVRRNPSEGPCWGCHGRLSSWSLTAAQEQRTLHDDARAEGRAHPPSQLVAAALALPERAASIGDAELLAIESGIRAYGETSELHGRLAAVALEEAQAATPGAAPSC